MAETGFGAGLSVGGVSIPFEEILSIELSGMSREAIDTSHMTTPDGWMTFIPSDMKDPGEAEVEVNMETSKWSDVLDLMEAGVQTVDLSFGSGVSWSCDGFLTEPESSIPHEDKVTASFTIKFSGKPEVS